MSDRVAKVLAVLDDLSGRVVKRAVQVHVDWAKERRHLVIEQLLSAPEQIEELVDVAISDASRKADHLAELTVEGKWMQVKVIILTVTFFLDLFYKYYHYYYLVNIHINSSLLTK